MSVYTVPLSPIPYQLVAITVAGRAYEITVRQLGSSLYASVSIDGEQITKLVRCVSRGELMPWADQRISVQMYWQDLQGDDDPQYEGLGSRWLLAYEIDDDE